MKKQNKTKLPILKNPREEIPSCQDSQFWKFLVFEASRFWISAILKIPRFKDSQYLKIKCPLLNIPHVKDPPPPIPRLSFFSLFVLSLFPPFFDPWSKFLLKVTFRHTIWVFFGYYEIHKASRSAGMLNY